MVTLFNPMDFLNVTMGSVNLQYPLTRAAWSADFKLKIDRFILIIVWLHIELRERCKRYGFCE